MNIFFFFFPKYSYFQLDLSTQLHAEAPLSASDGGAALVSLSWRIVSHSSECCALCFRLLWLGHWHDGWGSESSRPAAHRGTILMHMCSPPQLDLVVALTDAHYSQTYCNSLCQHCQPALTIYRLNYKHLHPTSYANFSIHAHVFAGIMLHGKHATSIDLLDQGDSRTSKWKGINYWHKVQFGCLASLAATLSQFVPLVSVDGESYTFFAWGSERPPLTFSHTHSFLCFTLSHSGTVKWGVVSMQLLGNQHSRENVLELNHMSRRITEDYPQTVNSPSRVNLVLYMFSHRVDLQRSVRKFWDLKSSKLHVTWSMRLY